MPVFTCDACNETLRMKNLTTHRCGASVSCIDCNRSWPLTAAKTHVSCVSEAERYQKSVYKGPKAGATGGKVDPQQLWTEAIAKAAAAAPAGRTKESLNRLIGYGNVPRKLPKFVNFAKNSIGVRDDKALKEIFAAIEGHMPAKPSASNAKAEAEPPEKASDAAPAEESTGKKRKRSESDSGAPKATTSGASKKMKKDGDEDDSSSSSSNSSDTSSDEDEVEKTSSAQAQLRDIVLVALAALAKASADGGSSSSSSSSGVKLKSLRKASLLAAEGAVEFPSSAAADKAFEQAVSQLAASGKVKASKDGKHVSLSLAAR